MNHHDNIDSLLQHTTKDLPPLKQTAGSVVSSKPEQMAFRTAPFANFPASLNLRKGNT